MLPFLNESSGGFPYPLGPPYNISPTTGAPSRADCLTHGFAEYYFSSAVSVAFQVSGATPVLFQPVSTVTLPFLSLFVVPLP